MNVGFRTAQETGPDLNGTGAKGQCRNNSARVSNPTRGHDWNAYSIDHRRQECEETHLLRFGILRGKVYTSNRRFQKMGRGRIAFMFLRTLFNTFNESYYMRDQDYWKEPAQKAS